jgi:hypothetical protein
MDRSLESALDPNGCQNIVFEAVLFMDLSLEVWQISANDGVLYFILYLF